MKSNLRILHLEDDPKDAELIASRIKTEGLVADIVLVDTGEDFIAALDRYSFDIILTDYKLPSYNGLSALDTAKEKCPDIPFLFVSGTMGEELAIDVLKKGATDYVLKNNLKRLVPAIKRAIREAEEIYQLKLAEEALRESETRYRLISDTISDFAYSCIKSQGSKYVINWIAGAMEKMSGYSIDEVKAWGCWKHMVHPDDFLNFDENILHLPAGATSDCEFRIIKKDGEIRWIRNVSQCMESRQENAIHRVFGACEDITERKQAEKALKESENKYRLLADNISDVIFVLDMNMNYTYVSPSVKILRGYEPEEVLKQSPAATLTPSSWDLATKNISEAMELEKSGKREIDDISRTLQLEMRRKDGTAVWTEVKVSFIRDEKQQPIAIMGVTRDITERKQAADNLQNSFEQTRKALGATVHAMAFLVETRDPYTAGHQRRVADLARAIATEMGLTSEQIDGIRMAGTIHDVGKISIPAEILSTPRKLTNIEFNLIKTHCQSGYDILKDIEFPWPIARMVLEHHERMNGSGYPNGLKGDQILLESRVISVSDVMEAMASHRPYRPALGIDVAFDEITRNRSILYDSEVVDACLKIFKTKNYKIPD